MTSKTVALLLGALVGPISAAACGGVSTDPASSAPSAGDDAESALATAVTKSDAAPSSILPNRCTDFRPAASVAGDDAGPAPLADGGASFFIQHPLPQVKSLGGHVLANPHVVPIFFADDPLAGDLERFVGSVGCTDYWRTSAGEYGVGDAVAGATARLDDASPHRVTNAQIESWLAAELVKANPRIEPPQPESLYVIFYGEDTVITEAGGGRACEDFGGYHTNLALPDGRRVAYAVVPRCGPSADGNALDTATISASHEIMEAVTDPYPVHKAAFDALDSDHQEWAFVFGSETGDLCTWRTDSYVRPSGFPFAVQRNWSNRAARRGGDPCLPATGQAFHTAALRMPSEVVAVPDTLSGPGVVVPKGTSKTVDIDLFDEGSDTLGLKVFDYSSVLGYSGVSTYVLDRKQAHGGDTVHLTISTPAGASDDPEVFLVYVTKGSTFVAGDVGLVTH